MQKKVSGATLRNWDRLNVNKEEKQLNHRANKKMSQRIIIPTELFDDKNNIKKVKEIIKYINENYKIEEEIETIMRTFCFKWLIINNLLNIDFISTKENVQKFIDKNKKIYDELLKFDLPTNENDILGILYQCLQTEGKKNQKGSYYTPKEIVEDMEKTIEKNENVRILDPCCGTGIYLISTNIENPKNLYGFDIDDIAIMICKTNLMVKYKEKDFMPNIYNQNFLSLKLPSTTKFDYIITNPPWGAEVNLEERCTMPQVLSGESFSYFIVKSIEMLKENGKMAFLLPESFLNVKVHADIREYLLKEKNINKITLYPSNFAGVITKFISVCITNKKEENYKIQITNFKEDFETTNGEILKNKHFVITLNKEIDKKIIEKVYKKEYETLENSKWGIGIVTGNNKEKLKPNKFENSEPIYTGKDIEEYKLLPCKNHIEYKREELQQVAADELYRANEKIVYKFISKKLTFAYDDKQNLFLNSANILIPNLENMSIKTTMAFLNSNLFRYIYKKKFGEIKVLRGNLEQLPFPIISKENNQCFGMLVDEILAGNTQAINQINERIYNIYEFEKEEISQIEGVVYGEINQNTKRKND